MLLQRCPQARLLMVVSIVSVTLLLWTYRSDTTVQFWIQNTQTSNVSEAELRATRPGRSACAAGRIVPDGDKVAVSGTKTVLLSAYREHRAGKREVRVLSVMLRSQTAAYRCLFCCRGQLHVSDGASYINYDYFEFPYGTADIMCPIPSSCEDPAHVAVTAAESEEDKEFLEVKNREEKMDSFPYDFTVCISTMFDFTNVLQLVQSLEMLQLLGVNRVVIYRHSNSPETQRVLDYYVNKGLVEVVPWSFSRFLNVSRGWLPYHGPGELHYFGQIPALNDCVYRYMYRSRYVALHDVDELILPQKVDSWSQLLPQLEKEYGADKCYMFENNVFPITASLPPPGAPDLPPLSRCCPGWQYVPGVNILTHLYHEPITKDNELIQFKIIVNPRAVFSASVHGLLRSANGCAWIHRGTARMYHTRSPRQAQLTADQLLYDDRLLRFGASFTPSVHAVLKESGLLPEESEE